MMREVMLALITGASSGIGRDMARILSERGYDLILVARRKTKLAQLKKELKTNVEIIPLDISSVYHCTELYEQVRGRDIDLLINNAGFGVFGEFTSTKLERELDLIDTNIKGLHCLTKLFLEDFVKKDRGSILNVASAAAFMPGPMMASYYASKAYVLNLTEAIYQELKEGNHHVYIGALCPGPVDTGFNKVAGVEFVVAPLTSYNVAEYALEQMEKGKLIIIPGFQMKLAKFFVRFIPTKLLLKITYRFQKKKTK